MKKFIRKARSLRILLTTLGARVSSEGHHRNPIAAAIERTKVESQKQFLPPESRDGLLT
jgi:hypothetical protein